MTGEAPDLLTRYWIRWNALGEMWVATYDVPGSHRLRGFGKTPKAAIEDMK